MTTSTGQLPADAGVADVSPPRGRAARVLMWPGLEGPRLLRTPGTRETFDEYRAESAGAGRFDLGVEQLAAVADGARLSGRGGAGFPFARKLRAVSEAAGGAQRVVHVVANGEEGEPASVKDRYLLMYRPHVVLDGLMLAASALGARQTHVYVSDPRLVTSIEMAIDELDAPVRCTIFLAPAGYVTGEETAVVRALSGGPAKPTAKPPRPYERGVDGYPTLVSNVETLAHLARAVRVGSSVTRRKRTGQGSETTLLTVTPDTGTPLLVEVPLGIGLRHVLTELDGWPGPDGALLLGGFFGGFLPTADADVRIDHATMAAEGLGLGCGAVLPLRETCPVSAAAELLAYFDRENARQCGACFNGTAAMHSALARLCDGDAGPQDLSNLKRWGTSLPGRGACSTLDGAARVVTTLLATFPALVASHADMRCVRCRHDHHDRSDTRFRVDLPVA